MTDTEHPTMVVGVGASAGGLEAFKQLLTALPSDSGMAFLLVQHLDPSHKSLLSELLSPLTEMTVQEADQGLRLTPNTVYIIRPDTALGVKRGKIELSQPTLHRGVRLPVNHLFRSLAREYGSRAVGIVLSGAGSDGSAGIREIKAAGGLVLAQTPESSGQPGMPQSAADSGAVDLVLEIDEIPAALARFATMPPSAPPAETETTDGPQQNLASLSEQAMSRLTAVLEAQAGFDLRVYKPATIERRVLRRMVLSGFDTIEPYLDKLRSDPGEQQTLVRDLLISVTEFFRDPEAFRALREMVLDPLVTEASTGSTLRCWVPGCATGEEAYSIAIELLEAIESHDKRLTIQVFATDVDREALAFARAAIYPFSVVDHVSPQRLKTYFKPLEGKGYQVRPRVRDLVSFAAHDLTKDPPFSRMNLVSCRNVLIYLTPEAQRHVLKVLHFALEPDGHLFLSTSESTGPQRELFSTLSKTQRIYRKLGASRPINVPQPRRRMTAFANEGPKPSPVRRPAVGDLARRAVLNAIAPPTLVVSEDGTIVFSHGELSPYIRIPEGDNPRFELSAVLRPELATRVRGVLYKCRRTKEPQFALSSPDGAARRVRIGARPAHALGDEAVVLTFEDLPREAVVTVADQDDSAGDDLVKQLEKELQATREDLRNTVEELETSNEELRSANEESMSMNEELQSSNEELEATTEELRSLNEELTTVNSQLREKVEQVEVAHDDLNNFFSSTKVATIFLDDRLCIKRVTPAARELLGIDHGDTGRFVGDIARELLQHDLDSDARTVLDHLNSTSRVVQTADGRWITRQVLPYRTESRRIEGVVVTFNDITELHNANEELTRRARRLELAWEAARGGVFEHQVPPDESTYVSEQWAQVLGYRCDELPAHDRLLPWLLEQAHPDDRHRLEQAYQDVVEGRADGYRIELRFRHKVGHWIWVRKIAKALQRDAHGRPERLLRMMIDITDLKATEASLRESESRFREMADGLPLMVWVHDEAGDQELVNETLCEFFGVSREEMLGGRWQMLVHPDDSDAYTREFYDCTAERRPFHAQARVKHADGSWRWIESWGRPRIGVDGRFRGFVGASAATRQAETEQRQFLETLLEHAHVCVAVMEGEELRYSLVNRAYQSLRPDVQMVGRTVAEVFPEAAAAGVDDDLRQVLRSGEPQVAFGYPAPVPGKPDARWDHQLVALPASAERDRSVLLITWDSTDRYRALEALRESEERFRTMADNISQLAWTCDRLGQATWYNRRWYEYTGTSWDEMKGAGWTQVQHPDHLTRVIAGLEEAVATGEPWEDTFPLRGKDGTYRWFLSRAIPIRDDSGAIIRWFGTNTDITQLREYEQKLVEADRQKDQFLAMLGHELRNPLAAIRSAADLVRLNAEGNPALEKPQRVLERQAGHMAKLLDGLLDIARIVRGKVKIDRQVIDLAEVGREVTGDLEESVVSGLDLRIDLPPEPLKVKGDRVRLAQVISNLLSNAVKFTPKGGTINLSLVRDDGMAVLKVRDTGIGISAELLPEVFEVFRQSDQSIDRAQGGLGLGLALAKRLVELHGGTIEARSDGPGQGAEFTVKLPLSGGPLEASTEQTPAGSAAALHILLIEDNEDAAAMLTQLLEMAGHTVTLAVDGQSGLANARQDKPDLILCDLGLPGGTSGFDVARELRSDERLADVPMIALSGYGRAEDKAQSEAAGFDAHLTKPIDLPTLQHTMEDVAGRNQS